MAMFNSFFVSLPEGIAAPKKKFAANGKPGHIFGKYHGAFPGWKHCFASFWGRFVGTDQTAKLSKPS